MFYVTDSATYNARRAPPTPRTITTSLPRTWRETSSPAISGLNSAGSPFDGMLLNQRRVDRRPIVLSGLKLLGGGAVSGTIYAKWGHAIFLSGQWTYDLKFVCGTLRVLTVDETTLAPTKKIAVARDVYLVE